MKQDVSSTANEKSNISSLSPVSLPLPVLASPFKTTKMNPQEDAKPQNQWSWDALRAADGSPELHIRSIPNMGVNGIGANQLLEQALAEETISFYFCS